MERRICHECECEWDRKGNVKDIVLCESHTAVTAQRDALLAALEEVSHEDEDGLLCWCESWPDGYDPSPVHDPGCSQARAAITAVRETK